MPPPQTMDELCERLREYHKALTLWNERRADEIWALQKGLCEVETKQKIDLGEWSACKELGGRDPDPPPPPPDLGP